MERMIVACASCKTRFEAAGYRDVHCPTCGSLARQATVRACPRCELPLAAREISDLVVDECSSCHGLFLDEIAIGRVLDDEDHTRAEALLASLPAARAMSPSTRGSRTTRTTSPAI
jgi:Zn-finger nucleic acid-binding protein